MTEFLLSVAEAGRGQAAGGSDPPGSSFPAAEQVEGRMEGVGSLLALPPQSKGTPVCQGFPSLVLENYASSKILGIPPSQPFKQWNCRLAPHCPGPSSFMKCGQISQVSLSAVLHSCRTQPRASSPLYRRYFPDKTGSKI